MQKRGVVVLFLVVLLFVSGCQQGYFGETKGQRAGDYPADSLNEALLNNADAAVNDDSVIEIIDCLQPQYATNPFCTPETGVGIENPTDIYGGGGAFAAQDKVLRQLDIERARMDDLAEQGQLAYVPSQDSWQLTQQTIQEINVLIGLPKDATDADRNQWYADWAEQEDQKFADAIESGDAELIAAEYDQEIQDVWEQGRTESDESVTGCASCKFVGAAARELDAAAKVSALRAAKNRQMASLGLGAAVDTLVRDSEGNQIMVMTSTSTITEGQTFSIGEGEKKITFMIIKGTRVLDGKIVPFEAVPIDKEKINDEKWRFIVRQTSLAEVRQNADFKTPDKGALGDETQENLGKTFSKDFGIVDKFTQGAESFFDSVVEIVKEQTESKPIMSSELLRKR
ncbi:MAG TPA: hypothetical protein VJJ21_04230 [Candidatus Nanoarchaeia archaeon]|nr:hypothetical protein [Candidatus Nanoarchaeia archaeon]